jgi:hypothetical protein
VQIKIGLRQQCGNFRQPITSESTSAVESLLCREGAALHSKNISSLLLASNVRVIETNHLEVMVTQRRQDLQGVPAASNRHALKNVEGTTHIATVDCIGEVPWCNVSGDA